MLIHDGEHSLRIEQDRIDATMLNRPDTSWRFVDAAGHEHRWHANGVAAESYDPQTSYSVPTLEWIETSPATDDYPASGYNRCAQCHERIEPRGKADDYRVYIPGMKRFYVDDKLVTKEHVVSRRARPRPCVSPA